MLSTIDLQFLFSPLIDDREVQWSAIDEDGGQRVLLLQTETLAEQLSKLWRLATLTRKKIALSNQLINFGLDGFNGKILRKKTGKVGCSQKVVTIPWKERILFPNDIKIVLGNFNVKIFEENKWKRTGPDRFFNRQKRSHQFDMLSLHNIYKTWSNVGVISANFIFYGRNMQR